jgi:cytochrome oxidase assembly protein ShyY1
MAKNYSENESRNISGMVEGMEKTILNFQNSHLILNKYGYVFTWISFENSLGLFTKKRTNRLKKKGEKDV